MDEHSDVYFPGAGIWQALREGQISTAEAAERLAALRDLMSASLGIPFQDARIPTEVDLSELRQFVPDEEVSDMLEVLRLLRGRAGRPN